MAFLFKRGKTADQQVSLALGALDALLAAETTPEQREKPDKAAKPEKVEELAAAIRHHNWIEHMINVFSSVDFEVRKETILIFESMIRNNTSGIASEYLATKAEFVDTLVDRYNEPSMADQFGTLIRACATRPELLTILLRGSHAVDGSVSHTISEICRVHVHQTNFEIAGDAFNTLKVLLTVEPNAAKEFMTSAMETFFSLVNLIIQSKNYVTRRQSLKLLGEILLDRTNFQVMIQYVSNKTHLKLLLLLLSDPHPNIQYEAFHVFKIFVANPEKPEQITAILAANKQRLMTFLRGFHSDKDDDQFVEEKALLIQTIEALPAPAPAPAPAAAAPAPAPATENPTPAAAASTDVEETAASTTTASTGKTATPAE